MELLVSGSEDLSSAKDCRIRYDHINMCQWDCNIEHRCEDVSCQVDNKIVTSRIIDVDILEHKIPAMLDRRSEISLCSL